MIESRPRLACDGDDEVTIRRPILPLSRPFSPLQPNATYSDVVLRCGRDGVFLVGRPSSLNPPNTARSCERIAASLVCLR